MSKITLKNKKGKITIINRLSYPETVNEQIYNAIASGMFEGLIPLYIRKKKKEVRIECVVQGLMPLNQYFSGIVNKKMFLDFVHVIALQIKSCEKNKINANNLVLQSDMIFVDSKNRSFKFIYWPVVNNKRENPPHLFLKQLPFDFKFSQQEDTEYLKIYKEFFEGINPFSINSFYKLVLNLSGDSTSSGDFSTLSNVLSGTFVDEVKLKYNDEKKKACIEYDPFLGDTGQNKQKFKNEFRYDKKHTFCSFCGTKNVFSYNYCTKCGESLQNGRAVGVKNKNICNFKDSDKMFFFDGSKDPTILGSSDTNKSIFPLLIRIRTNEVFLIKKSIFKIGTKQNFCDLYINDNNFISKGHADIITHKDKYYIVDHNSTNKTFVDGKVIPSEKAIEIFAGTQIRLANEDFIFTINPLPSAKNL